MKTIALKQFGQTLAIVIDSKDYKKTIADKDVREHIKNRVVAYNTKNNAKEAASLVKLFTAEVKKVEEKKEKAKAAPVKIKELKKAKEEKKVEPKKTKTYSQAEFDILKNELAEAKKLLAASKETPKVTSYAPGRKGER